MAGNANSCDLRDSGYLSNYLDRGRFSSLLVNEVFELQPGMVGGMVHERISSVVSITEENIHIQRFLIV